MEKYQIDFYNSLTPTEQLILKASAFKISFEYPSEITEFLVHKQKLTQKAVVACIEEAVRYNLFSIQQKSFRNLKSYETTINFMLFILPELTDFDLEWMIIKKKQEFYYYRNTNHNELLRDFLYCLLHDKKGFIVAQEKLLSANTAINYNDLSSIFDYPAYEPLLSNINIKILTGLIKFKTDAALLKLEAITEIEQFIEKTQNIFAKNTAYVVPRITDTSLFLSGNFEKRSAFAKDNEHLYYNLAIQSLIKQDYKSAISDFDKGIKIERLHLKNCQLPTNIFNSIYFLSTLLCIDAELATVRTQKILKALDKNTYSQYDYYFKAILYNLTNESAAERIVSSGTNWYAHTKSFGRNMEFI
jgi:tetratricopeptide (TPR) repeat protein